ncbi:MAG TPA: GPW/gp25 family protein, partial [Alphaproteobacteria bacterium]|nr:GPW/gp25 family protein [Alphaproteobacteria bacterium]
MRPEDEFLGQGWAFPPAFVRHGPPGAERGEAALTAGVEDIRQSLGIILNTTLGERIMRPEFGCNLEDQVFNAMNASMVSYVETLVKTAILYHEPRIDADQISVVPDQLAGRLDIHVSWIVRGANSR